MPTTKAYLIGAGIIAASITAVLIVKARKKKPQNQGSRRPSQSGAAAPERKLGGRVTSDGARNRKPASSGTVTPNDTAEGEGPSRAQTPRRPGAGAGRRARDTESVGSNSDRSEFDREEDKRQVDPAAIVRERDRLREERKRLILQQGGSIGAGAGAGAGALPRHTQHLPALRERSRVARNILAEEGHVSVPLRRSDLPPYSELLAPAARPIASIAASPESGDSAAGSTAAAAAQQTDVLVAAPSQSAQTQQNADLLSRMSQLNVLVSERQRVFLALLGVIALLLLLLVVLFDYRMVVLSPVLGLYVRSTMITQTQSKSGGNGSSGSGAGAAGAGAASGDAAGRALLPPSTPSRGKSKTSPALGPAAAVGAGDEAFAHRGLLGAGAGASALGSNDEFKLSESQRLRLQELQLQSRHRGAASSNDQLSGLRHRHAHRESHEDGSASEPGAARSGSGSLDAAASAAAAREAAAAAREDVEGAAESMRARNGREEGDDEPASASSRDQKQPSPQPELKQQPQQSQLSEEEDRALELREQNFFAPCDLDLQDESPAEMKIEITLRVPWHVVVEEYWDKEEPFDPNLYPRVSSAGAGAGARPTVSIVDRTPINGFLRLAEERDAKEGVDASLGAELKDDRKDLRTRELHFAVMERFRRAGRIYTQREMRILNKLPSIVRKMIGMPQDTPHLIVYEYSRIDPARRSFSLRGFNRDFRKFCVATDEREFAPHPSNPEWTVFTQRSLVGMLARAEKNIKMFADKCDKIAAAGYVARDHPE